MSSQSKSNGFFLLKLWSAFVAWQWTLALAAVAFFSTGRDYRVTGSWADLWLRSDGVQYIRIAQYGYFPDRMGTEGWFPGYPLCIRLLSPMLGFEGAAVAISQICFLFTLLVLTELLKLDCTQMAKLVGAEQVSAQHLARSGIRGPGLSPGSQERCRRCLILLCTFPTAFFFVSSYGESLFLLLVAAAFWGARTQRWMVAGLLASLASGVRPVGIVLLPALFWEWTQQPNRRLTSLIWLVLVPVPVLQFFSHLESSIGDFWGYLRFQNDMANRIGSWRHLHPAGVLGLLFGMLALGGLWKGRLQLRGSYLIYVGLSLMLPFWHSLWTSQARYSLVLFPLLLTLESSLSGRRFYAWLSLSLLAQAAATISFVAGHQIFF